jgi:hypothetical protein
MSGGGGGGGSQMVAVFEYYFYPEYALKDSKLKNASKAVQFLGYEELQSNMSNYEESKSLKSGQQTPSQASSRHTPSTTSK